MTTPGDELQKVLKTLSDPTRVRILWLLEREELVVQELMEVLGMAQSRVSRHLSILREAGLLEDRRDGTYVSYRFVLPEEGRWRDAWTWVSKSLDDDPTAERDGVVLRRIVESREESSREFFDSVGPEWDALRKVLNDDAVRARAITRLVAPGQRVADIGTGTGVLALELASLGLEVIGIDRSRRMLDAAQSKIERAGISGVNLRRGECDALPLEDGEVQAAFAHMVLQYLSAPQQAIEEMARVVAPGGIVVVADFVEHDKAWMRSELGVSALGFATDDIRVWFGAAGLVDPHIEVYQSPGRGRELPATFIASARRPPIA